MLFRSGESDLVLTNDRSGGRCVCRISDARDLRIVETLPFPVHCHDAGTYAAYYVNYDRLYRVGGYGYIGGRDPFSDEDVPNRCGVYKGNLKTGEAGVLVSIAEVAACGEAAPVKTGYPHYVTHLALNPSKNRLAFLHRYRVVDGGEITRLMTIGTDGSALRCLAKGFLSHFDWLDDSTIFIWGQDERALCRFREAAWLRVPGVLQAALISKRLMRGLRSLRRTTVLPLTSASKVQGKTFLRISDQERPMIQPVGVGILTEDGHPMLNPKYHNILVNDTYPNENKTRTLMVFDWEAGKRTDLGYFRMSDERPNISTFDRDAVFLGVDARIRQKFSTDLFLFTRSGLHCDLHPRWSGNGKQVAFDSIHEGRRQIYTIAVPVSEAR